MKHRIFVAAILGVMLGTLPVMTQACDPERASLDLFRRQGLNLLKPARDYVTVGGLVVRRGGGAMEYIDPFDDAPGSPAGGSGFSAIILSEAKKRTTTFDLALKLINGLLPGAVDVKGESSREVKLDQINSTGKRLPDQSITGLLARPATSGEVTQDLKQGLDVFVVQEVYSADALSVSASNAMGWKVTYGDGASIPACTTPASTGTGKTDTSKTGGDTAGAGQGDKKQPTEADKSGAAAKPASTQTSPDVKDTSKPAGGEKSGAAATQAAGGADKPSVGFGICQSGSYTLTFKSKKPGDFMPFAVRLKQIEIRNGKLAIKRGGVVPGGTLATAGQQFMLIDAQAPVIGNLQRRPKR